MSTAPLTPLYPLYDITKEQFTEIDHILPHEKIQAIKKFRWYAGSGEEDGCIGLKDAKDAIEAWDETRQQYLVSFGREVKEKFQYNPTREGYIENIISVAKSDFNDESIVLLKEDLEKCSTNLARWFLYRLGREML